METKIVILGASNHGKVVLDILRDQKLSVVGFIDQTKPKDYLIGNKSVIGKEEDLAELIINYSITHCIIAIGDNWTRSIIAKRIQQLHPSLAFISAISPYSYIAPDVTIGFGTIIAPGVIINTGSTIGNFCLLNTKSSLDHDGKMLDFSSLAPGVTTGGNVAIGYCSAICLGANIIHRVTIGNHSIVGAGSLVLHSVEDYQVVYGNPAKIIRTRQASDPYL